MNRRIILILTMACWSGALMAQKFASISLYTMPQKTMFLNKDDQKYKGIVVNSPTYAYSYGFIIAQNFSSRIGMEYGFCGSRVEQEFQVRPWKGSDQIGISNRKSVLYLNIPLLFRTELISRSQNILFISAGPQIGIMMSEDGIIPVYYQDYFQSGVPSDTVLNFDIAEAAGAYRKLTLATTGYLGWNRKLYKDIFLQFLLHADYTLTDIENKSFDTLFANHTYENVYTFFNKDRPATHILTIGVGVGLSLKIR